MIVFDKVTKIYGKGEKALDQVSFQVDKGEFVFLTGNSGAGKTTMLELILKDTEPSEGNIRVNGIDLSCLRERQVYRYRRYIGMVFQDFRLFPDFTVYENVAFAQRVVEADKKVMKRRVMEVLSQVGLEGKARCYPSHLSGGERQRTALARAVVNQPVLLLADEPTGNLDSKTSQDVLSLMKITSQKFAQTMVMITHNEEIAQTADRIVRIEDGRIVVR